MAGVLVGLSLTACVDFSDPPPEPSSAPLEIVANNAGVTRCSLNRTQVAAGLHEVVVITGGIDALVLVRDGSGMVLLEQHGDTWPQPAGGEGAGGEEQPVEGTGAAAPQISLAPGTYLVSCHYPGGGQGSTRLRVTP